LNIKPFTSLLLTALLCACGNPSSDTGATAPATEASAAVASAAESATPALPAVSDTLPISSGLNEEETKLRDSFDTCVEATEGATWPMQECIEAEYAYQEQRLNDNRSVLEAKLTEPQRVALGQSQNEWTRAHESKCHWDEETEGQGQRIDSNMCTLNQIAARADYLKALADDIDSPQ
jgi:uncharacterized protein YecT (DUF1311 family)